jgi:SpoVK/Ycf46/Vps4 family AAA+-type ATPase
MNRIIDGEMPNVYVISTSNKPGELDYAVTRRHVPLEVPFPQKTDSIKFMKHLLAPISNLEDADYKILADLCAEQSSFFEIGKMIRMVVKKKLLEDQKAHWFRKRADGTFVATRKSDSSATFMRFDQVPHGKLRGPNINISDLEPRFKKPICGCHTKNHVEISRFKENYPDPFEKKDE